MDKDKNNHTKTGKNEREVVLDLLLETEHSRRHSHILIHDTLDRCTDMTDSQRSFIKRLAEGTLERRIELDDIIRRHLKDPEKKLKLTVTCLLRMSIYQIYYMDSVTDYAACNEAVKLLKKKGLDFQSGFVNGLLRSVIREKNGESVPAENLSARAVNTGSKAAEQTALLSVKYSMPEEIVSLWERELGSEETQLLLESLLEIRPVSIRIREDISEEETQQLLSAFSQAGALVSKGNHLPYAYALSRAGDLSKLPGFAEGLWTVQDESSMLVTEAAGLLGNETVFDLCAAPGGKTMHAAGRLPEGRVYAFDVSKDKVQKIGENIKRMHLENVKCAVKDAREAVPALEKKADVVLCDVPCSGLGVIGKKRDIKYHISSEKLASLVYLQKSIVRTAASYVRPGGVLIYSTCTIHQDENEKMARYIEEELGLVPDPVASFLPESVSPCVKGYEPMSSDPGKKKRRKLRPDPQGNMVQLLPHRHHTDGFFIARFKKPI